MNPPRLIVGLGNPGPQYEITRHNAGFWFVDHLADKLKVALAPQSKFFGKAARAGDLWLLEPATFMNRSGQAVAALASVSSRAAATAATTASGTSRRGSARPTSGACASASATRGR
jgi:peptidyl-tRNA hydrolase